MAAIIVVPHFLGSSLPTPRSVRDELIRSGIHIVEYGILALLLHRTLKPRSHREPLSLNPAPQNSAIRNPKSQIRNWSPYLLAFLIAALYAIFDETQQSFIPNRQPALLDFLADSLGSLLALAGVAVMRR